MSQLTRLWHFSRPKLALDLLNRVTQPSPGRTTLFGPRQTGKTTLLREEIIPLAKTKGWLPVYADCWANRQDPMESIAHALQRGIDDLRVPAAGLQRTFGVQVKKVSVAGAGIELGEVAHRRQPTSSILRVDAILTELLRETRQNVLLILDEFQTMATCEGAENASAALRAALTQADKRVAVIFSGSSEVQLQQLFSKSKTPLYGFAHSVPYEVLGQDFIDFVATKFNAATKRRIDTSKALNVLTQLGHQPEPFLQCVTNAMAQPGWDVEEGLQAMLTYDVQNRWTALFMGLTDLQQAALLLVHRGQPPTAALSIKLAASMVAKTSIPASSMQRACEALEQIGLIQRIPGHTRSVWELADPVMDAWLCANKPLSLV